MDKYNETANKILKPFCKFCLPDNARGLVAQALREAAAEAWEDSVKIINDYWKFSDTQNPMSSWHEKQEVIDILKAKAAALRKA